MSVNQMNGSWASGGRIAESAAPSLVIEFFFDLICPWCLIGKRHLRAAMSRLAELRPEVQVRVLWRSHQLLTDIPPEGVPYQSFYLARLGSAEAVAQRRAQVRNAASAAGIELAFERIEVMPNTAAAHNLIAWVAEYGTEAQQSALIESLFTAYFIDGEDIGDLSVLRRRALGCGLGRKGLLDRLESSSGKSSCMPPLQARYGVSGVPFYIFNGRHALSGAYPADALLDVMLQTIRS